MSGLSIDDRQHRDHIEGALAGLVSAIILLDIVQTRITQAQPQVPGLLTPAMKDLLTIQELIRESQEGIALTLPCSRPSEVVNAADEEFRKFTFSPKGCACSK